MSGRLMMFLRRLLGGRPMTCEGYAFTDVISGKRVYYWRDSLGRPWLAETPWASFRVERAP